MDWKDESASPTSFRGIESTLRALLSEEFDKSISTEAQRRERICSTRGELGSTESVSRPRPSMVDGGVRAIGGGVVVGEFVDGKVSKWYVVLQAEFQGQDARFQKTSRLFIKLRTVFLIDNQQR